MTISSCPERLPGQTASSNELVISLISAAARAAPASLMATDPQLTF
jgi:hypothetical protein